MVSQLLPISAQVTEVGSSTLVKPRGALGRHAEADGRALLAYAHRIPHYSAMIRHEFPDALLDAGR